MTQDTRVRDMNTSVKVLYIMGLWRSGSTVLDIALGNHESMESVGELRNLPIVGWTGNGLCACGKKAGACEYWQGVRLRWAEKVRGRSIERLIELQDRYERVRSVPRLLRETVRPSSSFKEYGELVAALYETIREISGKDVIVDSTKYPARAYALLQIPRIDLRLIHLVRDGRAVIWSCKKNPNTDLEGRVLYHDPSTISRRTVSQWLVINLACDTLTRLAGDRAIRVRYEDFVRAPSSVLERIGRITGFETLRLSEALANGQEMKVGHTIAGNRVRLQGTIRLRADLEWMEKLSPEDRTLFWQRAGWLAKKYGYETC